MWTLILISFIDRGGIPVAMVGGLLHLRDASTQSKVAFVFGCVLAGWCGDLAAYLLGRYLVRFRRESLLASGPAGFSGRVARIAAFIEPAPRAWLIGGRLFHAINQFIPMAAGARQRPWRETAWTCALGNGVWFGLWGALTTAYQESVERWTPVSRWAGAALGLLLAYFSLRYAWSRLARSNKANAAQ